MKCRILGTETKDKTKGIPLSREAREMLSDFRDLYNSEIEEEFIQVANDKNAEEQGAFLSEETLRSLAPKISKNDVIRLVDAGHPVMLRVIGEALDEA